MAITAFKAAGYSGMPYGSFAGKEASVGAAVFKFFNPLIASVGKMMRR